MSVREDRRSGAVLLCASALCLGCGEPRGAPQQDGTTAGGEGTDNSTSPAETENAGAETSPPDSGPTQPGCGLAGFESEPSIWRLPAWPGSSHAFDGFSGSCADGANPPTYATADLDADGAPDLVVTSACEDGDVGREHWLVFGNEGDGFGEPTAWSLPQWPGNAFPFPAMAHPGCTAGEGPNYSVLDLDGDAAPELVVTNACDDGDVGDTRWIVFPNTGAGFGEAQTWTLPDWPTTSTPFGGVAGQESCTPTAGPTYGLLDLTADGRVDLVVTSACGDGDVGDSQWLVFPNEGNGFGEAIAWSLPAWPSANFAFQSLSDTRECDAGPSPRYGLAGLDGDAALDLIVTQTCGDDPVGRGRWLLFPNEGDGFGEAANWSLPDWPAELAPFPTLAAAADCLNDTAPTYTLADLDEDERPDLVVTFACEDAGIGSESWLVFPNEGFGFSDPQAFTLPPWPGAHEFVFDAMAGPGSCDAATRPAFGLIDLLGSGSGALTVTYACGEGNIGSERWLQFARDCE